MAQAAPSIGDISRCWVTEDLAIVPERQSTFATLVRFVALGAVFLSGCAASRGKPLQAPPLVRPLSASDLSRDVGGATRPEAYYTEAVRLDAEGSPAAVEAYLQAAVAAWPAVEMIAGNMQVDGLTGEPIVHDCREREIYQSAVVGLLVSAQKFGRWSPGSGLVVTGPQGLSPVETAFHGFVWAPSEFGTLHPVGDYTPKPPARAYRREGLGVPLVVVRNNAGAPRPFVQPGRQFAATALVRPVSTEAGWRVRLEFYDPLRESHVRLGSGAIPLASDISAPLAQTGGNLRQAWLEPFLRPAAEGVDDKLLMIEPYQPDKIPVLFVHGLLSDPQTWADMVNELQAQPHLRSRYQIWTFGYDTGEAFLTSAAALRRQLAELQAVYNPCGSPSASNIVIVGHSMGGLVANLQVTYSGDALWHAACKIPLEQLRTDAATRATLGEAFFFAPSDNVARVIYIGTPHLGSGWARRAVGRLGSALVEPSPLATQRHSQLMRDNPDVFSDELTRRFPTSVDLLEPSSPILNATARLPYQPCVAVHSIVGDGRFTIGSGPSDGVVPVYSAQLSGGASETFVDSKHSQEPRNEKVIAEVMRILTEHAGRIQ
jgi:pimeloyl-ACP methyl ester carboxylesterase